MSDIVVHDVIFEMNGSLFTTHDEFDHSVLLYHVSQEDLIELPEVSISPSLALGLASGIQVITDRLWQTVSKEHLDPRNKLTDEQWQVFVDSNQDAFAEQVSELADTYFREHLAEFGLQELFFDAEDKASIFSNLEDVLGD